MVQKRLIQGTGIVCLFIALVALFSVSQPSHATIGVGIGSGKIYVQEPFKPGGIYDLPPIPVLNTGDEPSEYGMGVEFHQDQPQLRPEKEWFTYSPATFHLDPGRSQVVEIHVTLPVHVTPGDYFAYLEARPIVGDVAGVSKVHVAAAAKLYFTVQPANLFQALYYRFSFFLSRFYPWPQTIFIVLVLASLLNYARRFVHIDVGLRKK